jgi:hypothetical protein
MRRGSGGQVEATAAGAAALADRPSLTRIQR